MTGHDGGVHSGVSIDVRSLRHIYRHRGEDLTVIDGLDLTIESGSYLSVTGRSGAGKSTLLALLGGLEAVQSGSVVVGDVDLSGLTSPALAAFRQTTVGFVFQHYGLLETLTALENVELAGALKGIRPRVRRERSRELLDAVGLSPRAGHRPLELSGGERQRVAIARAMVNEPRLVLADEPTGNLDEESSIAVIELLERMRHEIACTLVVVTHNSALAKRADRRLELNPAVNA